MRLPTLEACIRVSNPLYSTHCSFAGQGAKRNDAAITAVWETSKDMHQSRDAAVRDAADNQGNVASFTSHSPQLIHAAAAGANREPPWAAALRNQLDQLSTNVGQLTQKVTGLQDDIGRLTEDVTSLRTDIASVRTELRNTSRTTHGKLEDAKQGISRIDRRLVQSQAVVCILHKACV
ncbi:hypothetical protein NMY22_g9856 [Coprinellus aureogranulatus]|nr:hypothetical protein NMY22_g9856 [Coprinellus aureogranulatus]